MSVLLAVIAAVLLQQSAPADSEREIQRIAIEGWTAARAIANRGGAIELLGPVNIRLRELDTFSNLSARYAEIAIRAAVSAAQEERDELGLLLEHARDLSSQMGAGGGKLPEWPVPIDELEGELWLEVDRFTEAVAAFRRAAQNRPSPNAWIGLARAADRMGDRVTACQAYGAVAGRKDLPQSVEVEVSLYNLKCRV